uniref:Uncharacterized protein n=1 Tax=Arundo donax TaxID=35708 RepID=A0A0A8YY97_ARUDO
MQSEGCLRWSDHQKLHATKASQMNTIIHPKESLRAEKHRQKANISYIVESEDYYVGICITTILEFQNFMPLRNHLFLVFFGVETALALLQLQIIRT